MEIFNKTIDLKVVQRILIFLLVVALIVFPMILMIQGENAVNINMTLYEDDDMTITYVRSPEETARRVVIAGVAVISALLVLLASSFVLPTKLRQFENEQKTFVKEDLFP